MAPGGVDAYETLLAHYGEQRFVIGLLAGSRCLSGHLLRLRQAARRPAMYILVQVGFPVCPGMAGCVILT